MNAVLKILTLNCWGLPQPYPIGSKDRTKRILAIAEKLASSDYDIVSLQELWSHSDYEFIKEKLAKTMPFSFYFHSGFLGSGVAVYSTGPIVDTMMHRYSLNGYPHHVHRGDWFGGKVVGLARVQVKSLLVNVYATHIHAEYNKVNDLYLPHRVVQAYELAQFVRGTSGSGDLSVVLGDLNLEPTDLGLKLILANGNLKDSWVERLDVTIPEGSQPQGNTCDIPDNSYCSPASLKLWPEGKRIDYILYSSSTGTKVTVEKCHTTLGRIPDAAISYSDHEGLLTVLAISEGDNTCAAADKSNLRPGVTVEQKVLMNESISVIDKGLDKVGNDRLFHVAALVVLMSVFVYTINLELHYPSFTLPILFTRFVLTLMVGFSFFYGLVGLEIESKGLKAAKAGMQILLQS